MIFHELNPGHAHFSPLYVLFFCERKLLHCHRHYLLWHITLPVFTTSRAFLPPPFNHNWSLEIDQSHLETKGSIHLHISIDLELVFHVSLINTGSKPSREVARFISSQTRLGKGHNEVPFTLH